MSTDHSTKFPKFVVANFKSHQTREEARVWVKRFTENYRHREEVAVILAPSFTNLQEFESIQHHLLAVQDVSPFPPGAYTGAVNVRQLKEFSVDYCLIGHSERRGWFHETNQDVANKFRMLQEDDDFSPIIPIIFTDRNNIVKQLSALDLDETSGEIIAYEPIDAIGSGHAADEKDIEEVIEIIWKIKPKIPILYGGSVTSKNANKYLSHPDLSGIVVGGACLDPDEFVSIINGA